MSVRTSQAMKSAVPSRKPMNTSMSMMQVSAPSSTEILKLSASFACAATNSDSSRRASHTSSGPRTVPRSGRTSPASAERCASIPQVRSCSEGAVPGVAGEFGPSIRRRKSTTPPERARRLVPSECHPDAGVRAETGLLESNRILVLAVEEVIDASEERDVPVERIFGGEIDGHVARSIEARNGEIAVAIDPGADRKDIEAQLPRARRLPLRKQTSLVLWPAQQLFVQYLIGGLGVGVIEAQGQLLQCLPGEEPLDAVSGRAPDVAVGRAEGHRRVRNRCNEIVDAVVVVGHPETHGPVNEALLEARVPAGARLGLEIWVCEEEESRVALIELAQCRRLETGADGGLELGIAARDHPGRCE